MTKLPYHVRITTKSHFNDEVKLDLTKQELEDRILTQYRKGTSIFLVGKIIPFDDIERIHINYTEETSEQLLPIIKAERSKETFIVAISDEWFVTDRGIDLTDDLISDIPTSKTLYRIGVPNFIASHMKKKRNNTTKEEMKWYKKPEIMIPAIVIILAAIIGPLFTFYLDNSNDLSEHNQKNGIELLEYSKIESNVENLTIHTSRVHSDYNTEIIPFNITDLPAIMPVYFDCILTNNGDNALSILDYGLIQINNEDYPMSDYTYMNGGLFDKKGNQLQFPLNIDSKKSYKYYLMVGISIHPDAYTFISNNFTPFTKISINEITSHLAINGMDPYGNSVEPFIEQGNYFGFKGPNPENRSEQIFLIDFKTGSGNEFIDTFSWYKLNKF